MSYSGGIIGVASYVIIPTLLSLKHLMKQSCSPFIKDIHKCIGELLKDYRNNLSSIIQDTTLIKELEYDFNMGYALFE